MIPPQLGVAKQVTKASVVIVSVGADDLDWSAIIRLCAASTFCDNNAAAAYFQSKLATFTQDYYELLRQLADLPGGPHVIINSYYDPFGSSSGCLESKGLSDAKIKELSGELNALNTVLASGATASGFSSVKPNFAGHQLCSPEPYVQGLDDPAPFHPTAAGALAIALADEHVFSRQA